MSAPAEDRPEPRPFLGLHLTCCNVYARLYVTADGTAYAGHCPRCATPVRIEISDSKAAATGRFFQAG